MNENDFAEIELRAFTTRVRAAARNERRREKKRGGPVSYEKLKVENRERKQMQPKLSK